MMVVLLHTPPAVAAVLGSDGTDRLARVADVENGVVIVPEITPRRRITDLNCELE